MNSQPMTEDQIEAAVSRKIDRLDAAFMAGSLDQTEYNRRMKQINEWADVEYRFRRRNRAETAITSILAYDPESSVN